MKLEYKRESYMPGEPTGDDHAILRPWLLNDEFKCKFRDLVAKYFCV